MASNHRRVITGEYQSQGSNILSPKVDLVNENATMVRVAATVNVFVDNCEKAIAAPLRGATVHAMESPAALGAY